MPDMSAQLSSRWCTGEALVVGVLLLFALQGTRAETLLIKGGTVVNEDREFRADVLLSGGIIEAVGLDLAVPAGVREIDATGKLVMPGGVDPHTHLDWDLPPPFETSADDFVSGQSAALSGGTTTHIDFITPPEGDLLKGYEIYKAKAARSVMDYSFHTIVMNWTEKHAADMEFLVSEGLPSFKFYLGYKGVYYVTDNELLHGFDHCRKLGAIPLVHAENGELESFLADQLYEQGIRGPEANQISQPPYSEGEATTRALALARAVGSPLYVVHIMSRDAVQAIEHARSNGQLGIVAETIDSSFGTHDDSKVWDPDYDTAVKFCTSTPVRSKEHQDYVRAAVAAGTIGHVATDHTPWTLKQKRIGLHDFRIIPYGLNTIDSRMLIVWDELVNSGMIGRPQYVKVTSTQAAKVFNLYPRKGVIMPGSDADILIFDPEATTVISAKSSLSKTGWSVYEGRSIKGKVDTVISQGEVVWRDGKLSAKPGRGRLLRRKPFAPAVYDGLDTFYNKMRIAREFPYGATPVQRSPPRDEL